MALYDQDAARVKDDVDEFLITCPITVEDGDGGGEKKLAPSAAYVLRQLWTLVKMMRTARRSLRSNTAFYSYLKQVFPWADFRDVTRDNQFGKGLQISILVDGKKYSDDSLDTEGNGGYNNKVNSKEQPPSGDGEGL